MARPDSISMLAWRRLLQAHRSLTDVLDAELRADHGFGLDWYDVLVQLEEAGGRLRMGALADATLFTRTDCSRIVDRMERAGLVSRERAPEDGRGVYAGLTEAGSSALRRAATTHLDGIARHFSFQLADGSARSLADALEPLVD